MPIMEISVVPLGTIKPSVSQYVARSIKILQGENNITYQLTAMGTIVEGDSIEQLLAIASKMHHSVFDDTVKRVVTTIKIDDRKDKKTTISNKVQSVEEKLKRQ